MEAPLYIALLHYPVLNRHGQIVTTAVTNMDLHDIARSARTFGARAYFVVNPLLEQQEMIRPVLDHWKSEIASDFHPDRVAALSLVRVVQHFSEVIDAISSECGGHKPEVVLTSARKIAADSLPSHCRWNESYEQARSEMRAAGRKQPVLIVFGTGWGIAPSFFPAVDRILAPIYGSEGDEGYNHLSVRAAAAIILSRLYGQ